MVYYRKYRRFTRRYSRRRTGVSKLSRYNTYRNRSSTAQASQIYHLARRINRIQKLNKPEIELAHTNFIENLNFVDGLRENAYPLLLNGESALSSIIDGKFARLNSLTFTMSFRYENADLVQYEDDNYTQRLPQPVYLRLLFVQTKATRQARPDAGELFDTTSGFTRTRGPLADGAARIVKILSDRKFMVNFNNQTINRVIRFKYLRNYYKPATEPVAKGDVFVYLQCWNPNALIDDATTNVILTANVKTAYTDA